MLFQDDPILRQVKKLAEALARLSGVASGDGESAAQQEREEVEALHRTLFAMSPAMTAGFAPASLAVMVAPHQREAAATLLEVEATLARSDGDERAALVREAQARAIRT